MWIIHLTNKIKLCYNIDIKMKEVKNFNWILVILAGRGPGLVI
jgi:hypothetical protein